MRLIDADSLRHAMYHEAFEKDSDDQRWDSGCWIRYRMFERVLESMKTIEAVQIVRCKDCKHRPERPEGSIYYEDLNFPDGVCPCQCDDYYYSYMPDDDWFCKNGERKED